MKIRYVHKTFSSDQRMRSVDDQTAHRYTIDFEEPIQNIIGMQLLNASIPRSEYIVDSHNDTIDVETIKWVSSSDFIHHDIHQIYIPHGHYTIDELIIELNTNPDLIFSIYNSKTQQILIALQQVSDKFNGFRLLFGSGPNNYRSAARLLGFESGVDSLLSTPPDVFAGILSEDSNTIITHDDNDIGKSIISNFIVENIYSEEIGVVTGTPIVDSDYVFRLSNTEHTVFNQILQNPNILLTIGLDNNYNTNIYENESFTKGFMLTDDTNTYIIFINDDTLVQQPNVLIKYKHNIIIQQNEMYQDSTLPKVIINSIDSTTIQLQIEQTLYNSIAKIEIDHQSIENTHMHLNIDGISIHSMYKTDILVSDIPSISHPGMHQIATMTSSIIINSILVFNEDGEIIHRYPYINQHSLSICAIKSNNLIDNLPIQRYTDSYVSITYSTSFNSYYTVTVNQNCMDFVTFNNSLYMWIKNYAYNYEIQASYVIEHQSEDFMWKSKPYSRIESSQDFIWDNIQFNFSSHYNIHHFSHTYKGNIRNSITLSSHMPTYFNLIYQSNYPNSILLQPTTQSIVFIDEAYLHPIEYYYDSSGNTFFKYNCEHSFFWSYSDTFTNSTFVSSQSFAHISYNQKHSIIYFSSQFGNINSMKLLHPYSIKASDKQPINTNSTYEFSLDDPGEFTLWYNVNNRNISFDISHHFSSEIYFDVNSCSYNDETVSIYTISSPLQSQYTYSVLYEGNCIVNSTNITNNFQLYLHSLGDYEIHLDYDKQFGTRDILHFKYENDIVKIIKHNYDVLTDKYIIQSFQLPFGASSININNVTYLPNSVITFSSFMNCPSPVFVINYQSCYFTNCQYAFIHFSSINQMIDNYDYYPPVGPPPEPEYEENILQNTHLVEFNPAKNHSHIKYYKELYTNTKHNITERFVYHFQSEYEHQSLIILSFQAFDIHDNSFGIMTSFIIHNRYKYFNKPYILATHKNELGNSVHVTTHSFTYLYHDHNSIYSLSMTHEHKSNASFYLEGIRYEYQFFAHPYVDYISLGNDNYDHITKVDFVEYTFNSYNLFLIENKVHENVVYKRNVSWKYIPEPNISYSDDAYIPDSLKYMIMKPENMNKYYSYKNHILQLTFTDITTSISSKYLILLKPVIYDQLVSIQLDGNLTNNTTRKFLYFNNKDIISPFKFDLEQTPIIQVVCERIGNLHTQAPIGFYNFSQQLVIPNQIEFPLLSKASKVEISLKRRNPTIDKRNNENIYYQWNGMEHTLVVQFQCIDLHNNTDYMLS